MADYRRPDGATAAQFAEARWHGPTRQLQRIVTVGATVVDLLLNNPRRVAWLAQNRGATDVATGDVRDVTAANGFLLAAAGGLQSMNAQDDGEAVTYPVYAISTVAGITVRVVEIERI